MSAGNKKMDDGEPDKMQIAMERIKRFKRWIAAAIKSFFCAFFKRAKVAASEKTVPVVMVNRMLRK
jgi:hypothetical protein